MHSPISPTAAAAVAGLLSHWCWFIHGEHDVHAGLYVKLYAALTAALFTVLELVVSTSHVQSMSLLAGLVATYAGSLFTSIAIYRLFFSGVRHIQGPLSLKLTKLTHFWSIQSFNNFKFLHALHQQYGDVVRTGPNEVTLFTTEAFHQIYAPGSQFTKTAFYSGTRPLISLIGSRDPHVHSQYRKAWDQAFSFKALELIEPTVRQTAEKFMAALEKRVGKPTNVAEWCERYTFDLMGLFGFNYEFKLLDGRSSIALELFEGGHKGLALGAALPWLKPLGFAIPPLRKRFETLVAWATKVLDDRLEASDLAHHDIMTHIIDDVDEKEGRVEGRHRLLGDLMLVLAAGSDPMAQCLSNLIFYLADEPRHVRLIREELAAVSSVSNHRELQYLPHLNACIYETLRLNPPVPAAGLRTTPKGGFNVNGVHIPAGTTVLVPQYSLFRREDCFKDATSFIPERFTSKPELMLDKTTWNPWNIGQYSCVGKNLGLLEIRIALAMLVTRFEWELAPGDDGTRMFSEARDCFTMLPGRLDVLFTQRKL